MMTGIERFQALMSGNLPDRVPVLCNLLDQGARELGMGIREYYSRGEHVAEGQLRLREKYGYDGVVGMFYVAMEAEFLGCRNIIYAEDGPPNVGHLVINSPEDIEKLEIPEDFNELPRFRELAACIRILKQKLQGNYPVTCLVTGSFSLPALLMGISGWMELFLCGSPELRALLLDKCSLFCRRQIAALREAGADLIAYTSSVSTSNFITLRQFHELALPTIIRDMDGLGTSDIIYFNGGGQINPHLKILLEQTDLRAFYINPFDDIGEARRLLDGQALLVAAINDIRLIDWTPEKIAWEVRRIMEQGKQGGRFVFSTLMMPLAIPEENIRAMLEAAYRYGRYEQSGA
jgi:uroporphyrinogen decarboxylase